MFIAIGIFFVFLLLGMPVAFSIGLSGFSFFMIRDLPMTVLVQKSISTSQSFTMLAIPLFILAGNIMNNGGIAKRLVNFAQLFVGKIPGSMAQANILGNMLFGALSGSSVAAASAMGGCISPIEEENGYDPAYSAAANIALRPHRPA